MSNTILENLRRSAPIPPLYPFQEEELPKALELLGDQHRSAQLIAPTGAGKTYFTAHLILRLRNDYPDKYPLAKPIFWVVPPTVIEQVKRVVYREFRLANVFVTSYEQLRATLGTIFLTWEKKIVNDIPTDWPVWKRQDCEPSLIVWDESQKVKNEESLQSCIALSWNIHNGLSLFMSATPYSRPCHTRVIATGLRPLISWGPTRRPLTNLEFPSWIKEISAPKSPLDWCPSAMKRIQEVLEPYTIRFGKLKYEHRTFIKTMFIQPTAEQAKIINDAFEEYQEARMKAECDPLSGFAAVLVALLKLRQKSELVRAPDMAAFAHDIVSKDNKQVIIATAFSDTQLVINSRLHRLGYTEDDISLIRGGQTLKERQKNIDAFQDEKSKVMLLMFSAGGAGLSLHHYKPRNKKPRAVALPFVWNPEEFVQVLGRAHRINSASTTHQYVMGYSGTVEERVCARLFAKMKAQREVTRTPLDIINAVDKELGLNVKELAANDERVMLQDKSGDDEDEELINESDLPPIDIEE